MEQVTWTTSACRQLLAAFTNGGWPYESGGCPAVEPTVIASLALLASRTSGAHDNRYAVITKAAAWVASLQSTDGAVDVSEEVRDAHWPTAYAVLLWANMKSHDAALALAVSWLERTKGATSPKRPGAPSGHDTTLTGWPWTEGTHSWVEPTAVAILALVRAGMHQSIRVRNGYCLLRDRMIAGTGCNYGNTIVLDKVLRPLPGPTGLAIMALACESRAPQSVEPALQYLETSAQTVRTPLSLCWELLGLAAFKRRPLAANTWLREAYGENMRRQLSAFHVAHLLLAATDDSLGLFGIPQ